MGALTASNCAGETPEDSPARSTAWLAFARNVADEVTARAVAARPFVGAMDGPGCCGKSTLALALAEHTGAAMLCTDDFHLPRNWHAEANAALPYRRWSALVEAAALLAQGRPATFEPIDWESLTLGSSVTVEPAPIVLVEGIASLHPDVAGFVHFAIWVDGVAATRLSRVARRDSDNVAKSWRRYVPFEHAYLAEHRPWRRADLIVLGSELHPSNWDRSFAARIEAGAR